MQNPIALQSSWPGGLPRPRRRGSPALAAGPILLFLVFLMCFILTTFKTPIPKSTVNAIRWVALFGVTGYFFVLRRYRVPSFPLSVLLYVFLCLLTAINAEAQAFSMAKFVPSAFTMLLMFYLLPAALHPRQHLTLLLLVAILLNVLSGASFIAGLVTDRFANPFRYGSLFGGPNSEGVYAGFALMSGLWLYAVLPKSKLRYFVLFTIAANAFAIWATSSRSSFFGVALGGFVWAVIQILRAPSQRRTRLIQLLALLALLIFTQRGFFVRRWAKMTRSAETRTEFLASREPIWRKSWESFLKRPLLGFGFGVSELVDEDRAIATHGYAAVRDGSGYLGLLESIGILGAAGFALIMWGLFRGEWRLLRGRIVGDYASASHASFCMSLFLLVNLIGEPWVIGPGNPTFQLFWLYVAAAIYFRFHARREWRARRLSLRFEAHQQRLARAGRERTPAGARALAEQ